MVFPPTELLSYIVELRVFSLLYPFHLIHHQVLLAYFPNVFQIHPLLSISANVTIVQAPTSFAQITAKVYNSYSCFYSFGSSCHLSYFPSSLRTKWTLQGLLSLWSWSCLWTITYHSSLHSLPQAAGFLFALWTCHVSSLFGPLHMWFPLSKMLCLLIFPGADSYSTQFGSDVTSLMTLLNSHNHSTTFPFFFSSLTLALT